MALFMNSWPTTSRRGRALYIRRVSEEIRKNSLYLEDGFAELIAKKKMELGL